MRVENMPTARSDKEMELEGWLSIGEFARQANCSPKTVERRIHDGKLRSMLVQGPTGRKYMLHPDGLRLPRIVRQGGGVPDASDDWEVTVRSRDGSLTIELRGAQAQRISPSEVLRFIEQAGRTGDDPCVSTQASSSARELDAAR
jgi:hypothetical protein